MNRTAHLRLKKLEEAHRPPQDLTPVLVIAADDPEAERLMAEHEDKPGVTLIVLTGVHRTPGAIVS